MHTNAGDKSLPGSWQPPSADRPVTIDSHGRRCVLIEGADDFAVIDPAVWDRLHIKQPLLTDEQLRELHHDDFAHGMLAALREHPDERPVKVGSRDMRMSDSIRRSE